MVIRKATSKDASSVAACLFLAMEEILYTFIGRKDPEAARSVLLHFAERDNNQYSYQNCWVAEEGNRIVAAVNLYDGAELPVLRHPVVAHIRSRFNPSFDPEDETGPGEHYIDSLGVDPERQGEGIGSKILYFLIKEFVVNRGETLGLLVDKENPDAKRLYLRSGFKIAGEKYLFGKQMEHLQYTP